MKISKVVEFLEKTQESHGDIEIQAITGFWVRVIPATGERVVVCSMGEGVPSEER